MRLALPSIAVAAALGCAFAASPAAARELVYVGSDHNVWFADRDGTDARQITADAGPSRAYASPTVRDDGAIVSVAGDNQVRVHSPSAQIIGGPWDAPRNDPFATGAPTSAHVVPDGGYIVFQQLHSDAPSLSARARVRIMRGGGPTADDCASFDCRDGFLEPRWIPGTAGYGMISADRNLMYVSALGGMPEPWLRNDGADIESFDVSRTGTHTLFQTHPKGASAGDPGELILWENAGPPSATSPGAQLCRVSNFGDEASDPRWSIDGSAFAWEDAQGVWVSPAPRDADPEQRSEPCSPLAPVLVAAGARDPDFGPSQPNESPPAPTGGGSPAAGAAAPPATAPPGTASQPVPAPMVHTDPAEEDLRPPAATVSARSLPRLRTVLARGLPATVRCSEACSITAVLTVARPRRARRPGAAARTMVVARGRGRLTRAGTRRVPLRFTRQARRSYRRARSLRLTLRVTVRDVAGNARTVKRRVTLRR